MFSGKLFHWISVCTTERTSFFFAYKFLNQNYTLEQADLFTIINKLVFSESNIQKKKKIIKRKKITRVVFVFVLISATIKFFWHLLFFVV